MNSELEKKLVEYQQSKREAEKLWNELMRSLAIEHLWPGAFDLGKVSSVITTKPAKRRGATHVEGVMVVRAGDQQREFDLNDVPDVLRNGV